MQKEHIQYRIERARETYNDALLLYERGSLNSCVNRLYYSVFYMTIALLLDNSIEVKSHNGIKQKLGEVFVLPGIISKDHAKIFSVLADFRHKGDYDDLYEFSKEIIERLLEPTKDYIDLLEKLITE